MSHLGEETDQAIKSFSFFWQKTDTKVDFKKIAKVKDKRVGLQGDYISMWVNLAYTSCDMKSSTQRSVLD